MRYRCQSCGYQSLKWLGRCPTCGQWDSFLEHQEAPQPVLSAAKPQALTEIELDAGGRWATGIGEFDRILGGGVIAGSLILIGGEPGIGKCVTGDTRVLDPSTGDYLPITAWAHGRRSVLALEPRHFSLAPATVVAFHRQGKQPIVQVQTALGRRLRCTPSHPLLTPQGWRPVGELAVGARVAAPRALPVFGREPMSEAEVKLIAYILSDGSAQSAVTVTNTHPAVGKDLQTITATFGVSLRRYLKRGTAAIQYRFVVDPEKRAATRQEFAKALRHVRAKAGLSWLGWAKRAGVSYWLLQHWRHGRCVPTPQALLALAKAAGVEPEELAPAARDLADQKTPVARFLERVGLRFQKAAGKHVPPCIFRLPPEKLALFLKTLFSCDGSVYMDSRGNVGLSYATKSRRLAEDVQHLLLRFGIICRLRTKVCRVGEQPYESYELEAVGAARVQKFIASIGINGHESALTRIAALQPQRGSTRMDTIPTGPPFWAALRQATGGTPFAEISRRAGVFVKNRRHERPLCRATVAKLADAFPHPLLTALGCGDVYWDVIEAIIPAGEEEVFDLTVPELQNFVAADLIIHNSTLMLQAAGRLAHSTKNNAPVIYVSGEEALAQIKLRAERLGLGSEKNLLILSEQNLLAIEQAVKEAKAAAIVIDSIQAVFPPYGKEGIGSTQQVGEATFELNKLAKSQKIPIFLIGHITKSGEFAGPKAIEHMVDVVLYLEGGRESDIRILRSVKNRYGSTDEIGVFQMKKKGLIEITNPSEFFTDRSVMPKPGSVIVPSLEGTRPILIEIQALVSSARYSGGYPQRRATGLDYNRIVLLLAVIEKRLGLHIGGEDVYLNVAGGLTIRETATDLGVTTAVVSSFKNKPIPRDTVVVGEVSLSGEVRRVRKLKERLSEAAKLGYKRAVAPAGEKFSGALDVVAVTEIEQAMEALGL